MPTVQSKHQLETTTQFSPAASSADWRFFLPITEDSRVLIVGGREDFSDIFRKIGVSIVVWLPAGDMNSNKLNGQAGADMVSSLTAQSFPPKSFDIVAIPFGIPDGNALMNEVDVFHLIHRLMAPEGTFLMGFSNIFGFKRNRNRNLQLNFGRSTPRRAIRSLRLAGLSQMEVFGAISNLYTPEYIFPLNSQVLSFALQHRYRHKMRPVYCISSRTSWRLPSS